MNWIILTILAVTFRAVYSLGTRLLSTDVKVSPITQTILLTTTAGFLGLLLSPIFGGLTNVGVKENIIPLIFVSIVTVLGNVVYFKAQKKLDAGTTQVAFSSILIWGVILSILILNSSFSYKQLVGIVLMLLAIILIQYRKGSNKYDVNVLYILVSAFFFAFFQVISASISKKVGTSTYLIFPYFGNSLILLIVFLKQVVADFNKLKTQLKNTWTRTLFASGSTLLYTTFSYLAYKVAPDSGVVVVLLTCQVVLSVIFGAIFLKEREFLLRKLLAAVLAFVSAYLIKL